MYPNRVPTKMFEQAIKDNDRGRFIFVNPKKSAYFPTFQEREVSPSDEKGNRKDIYSSLTETFNRKENRKFV